MIIKWWNPNWWSKVVCICNIDTQLKVCIVPHAKDGVVVGQEEHMSVAETDLFEPLVTSHLHWLGHIGLPWSKTELALLVASKSENIALAP